MKVFRHPSAVKANLNKTHSYLGLASAPSIQLYYRASAGLGSKNATSFQLYSVPAILTRSENQEFSLVFSFQLNYLSTFVLLLLFFFFFIHFQQVLAKPNTSVLLAGSNFHQRFFAKGVQAVPGRERLCDEPFVKSRFDPEHELSAEFPFPG